MTVVQTSVRFSLCGLCALALPLGGVRYDCTPNGHRDGTLRWRSRWFLSMSSLPQPFSLTSVLPRARLTNPTRPRHSLTGPTRVPRDLTRSSPTDPPLSGTQGSAEARMVRSTQPSARTRSRAHPLPLEHARPIGGVIEARRTAWREHRRLRACERFPLRPDEVAQLGVVRAAIAHVAVHEDDL